MASSTITTGIKTNIRKGLGNSGTPFPMSTLGQGTELGRVTRVVLGQESCTENEWILYQKSQAVYGVFYRKLQTGIDGQVIEEGAEKFAYCFHTDLRRIPVKNEIVRLKSDIGADLAAQNGNLFQQKTYWTEIIPAWNHPNSNMLPDLKKNTEESDKYFTDQGDMVNPLQLCPGDVTLEGRHGESLRFGGTWYPGSPVAVEDSNGKAYAILRVGQGVGNNGQGDKTIYEDVNQDLASLYFTTAHIIPLNQAFLKRNSWKDRKVTEAKDYNKPQILMTADRIWINGRDDIEFSSKNFIGFTSEQINLDGQEQVSLDATKIYLGDKSQNEKEPVLKGRTTTEMMSNLTDQFIILLDTMIEAGNSGNGDPGAFIGALQSVAKLLKPVLKTYQDQLPTLHSKKVYTE